MWEGRVRPWLVGSRVGSRGLPAGVKWGGQVLGEPFPDACVVQAVVRCVVKKFSGDSGVLPVLHCIAAAASRRGEKVVVVLL